MTLDPTTALATATATTGIVTTMVAATTALRHDTPAGRTWTAAFLAIFAFEMLGLLREQDDASPRLAEAAMVFALVFAFGALWSALREFDGRPRWLRVVLPVAGGAALVSLADASVGDLEAHVALGIVTASGFAGAGVVALHRGRMRHNVHSRGLQLLLGVFVVVAPLRGIVLALNGGRTDRTDAITAIALSVLFTGIAMALVGLRVERLRSWWGTGVDLQARDDFTVLNTEAFALDAQDRIDRSVASGTPIGLVWVELSEIEAVNAAFGRARGDLAIWHVAQVIRATVPPFDVVGHLGGGRFAVLTTARAGRPVERLRTAIGTGLQLTPWPTELPMPVPCRLGAAVADPGDTSLDRLLDAARAAATEAALT